MRRALLLTIFLIAVPALAVLALNRVSRAQNPPPLCEYRVQWVVGAPACTMCVGDIICWGCPGVPNPCPAFSYTAGVCAGTQLQPNRTDCFSCTIQRCA